MSPQKTIRSQARALLKNKYAPAVCGFVILLIPLYCIDGGVTAVACALSSAGIEKGSLELMITLTAYPLMIIAGALLSPFINGYIRMYYRNAMNAQMDLNDLFYYFNSKRYARALTLDLSLAIRMLLPALLFYLPVIIYSAICNSLDNGFINSVLYKDFYFILSVMSTVLTVLYSLKYFTVFTLFIEYEEIDSKQLFALSKSVMRGFSGAAAKLIFSYTPWMLLCMFILPALYVVPYMTQGLCLGARWFTQAAMAERRY